MYDLIHLPHDYRCGSKKVGRRSHIYIQSVVRISRTLSKEEINEEALNEHTIDYHEEKSFDDTSDNDSSLDDGSDTDEFVNFEDVDDIIVNFRCANCDQDLDEFSGSEAMDLHPVHNETDDEGFSEPDVIATTVVRTNPMLSPSLKNPVARAPNGYWTGDPEKESEKAGKNISAKGYYEGPLRVGIFGMRATPFRQSAGSLS